VKRIILALFILLMLPPHAGSAGLSAHSAVRQYIEAHAPWSPEQMRVDFLTQDPELPTQKKNMHIRVEPAGTYEFIGDMVFLAAFYDGAVLIRTETVRTRIEVLREVVVAARNLPAGTIVSEEDLRMQKKWLRRMNVRSLENMEDAVGRRLSSLIRSGMEIANTMLKDVPLVKKGKPVKIVFNTAMMQITTVGLPEEDGAAGAIIRVRNLTSNKIIYGRVVGDALVELNI
jgi:flagella basal body P-ring formation protein FlgA